MADNKHARVLRNRAILMDEKLSIDLLAAAQELDKLDGLVHYCPVCKQCQCVRSQQDKLKDLVKEWEDQAHAIPIHHELAADVLAETLLGCSEQVKLILNSGDNDDKRSD